jgi:hypothetical protein
MPKMTNAKSVDVLDSADAFEAKLRWILFKQENEEGLAQHMPVWFKRAEWGLNDARDVMYGFGVPRYGDEDFDEKVPERVLMAAPYRWQPGDPLYPRPLGQMLGQQVTRFMIDLFGDGEEPIEPRCSDCEVTWVGRAPCWMCGKPKNLDIYRFDRGEDQPNSFLTYDQETLSFRMHLNDSQFRQAMRSLGCSEDMIERQMSEILTEPAPEWLSPVPRPEGIVYRPNMSDPDDAFRLYAIHDAAEARRLMGTFWVGSDDDEGDSD